MAPRSWIVEGIGSAAFEQLASGLSGSELQSLLLEVMQRRAGRRAAKELLSQYTSDAFCAPSPVDQRTSLAIDAEFLAAADRFEAIELSPVAPLGACSAVALTDQHRVVSALRSTEVLSDPTNVFALELARRLRSQPSEPAHLITSQRVVRAQPTEKAAGHTQHFRLLALGSGGPEARDHAFTVDTLVLHVRTVLAGLDRLEQRGYGFSERSVTLLAVPERRALAERVASALSVPVQLELLEHAYYSGGLRFKVWVTAPDGTRLPLIDGGTFQWLAQLTSNRRAVFVATGIGAQLIALRFQKAATSR